MTSPSSPEGSGLIERALSDAKWLEAFVHSNTGMTGHDWKKRGRAEQHVEDVYQLTQAASALSAYEGRLEEAREALRRSIRWFKDYEHQHRAKGTAEANLKADTNEERAEFCRAALTALEQSGEGLGASISMSGGTAQEPKSDSAEGH